jgi:hypothetical protein
MDNAQLERLVTSLAAVSRSLSDTAAPLTETAVPVAVPVKMPGNADPLAPPGVLAAIAAGAPFSVPPAGLPLAQILGDHADPIARSAPLVAQAVPVFAPPLNVR